jgi:regulator of RNase E activity RraA
MKERGLKSIITYIKRNRVSTTEVADCLGKTGVIADVHAVNQGLHKVGPVRYIYGHSESNWSIHEQARDVQEGEIVIMDGIDVKGRALVGELVTKFLTLYRGAEAVVMLGNARDANNLIKHRYPVWCRGFNPVGCFNTDVAPTPKILRQAEEARALYDGGIAVCDDCGVVVIPATEISEEFLKKLDAIEEQEDIWFNCIDRLKWDTYDTVCLKKYQY